MSSHVTLQLDGKADQMLEEMQAFFGSDSKADALRNVLELAGVVLKVSGADPGDRTLIIRHKQTLQERTIVFVR